MTFSESARDVAPRSLWFEQLRRWAAPRPVDEWLVEEANVRGFWGASGRDVPDRSPDVRLSDEDLIAGLLSPHASVDGRIFKLVVRMLQSQKLDVSSLLFRCRRERSDGPLHWLVSLVPDGELSPSIRELRAVKPRGFRPLGFRYDPGRLLRRPATKADLWRTRPS